MTEIVLKVLAAVSSSEIDLTNSRLITTPNVFIGIKFLDLGGLEVTPAAGTFSITVKVNGSGVFESIPNGDNIDGTMPIESLSFSGNASAIKYTPVSLVGAESVQITLMGNN